MRPARTVLPSGPPQRRTPSASTTIRYGAGWLLPRRCRPVRGANSFSRNEARRRIERHGYSAVSGLTKDGNGVWRGHATRNDTGVDVWLDYKGNVGQQ